MKNIPGAVKICVAIILGTTAILIGQACAPRFASEPPPELKRKFELVIPETEKLKDDKNFCANLKDHFQHSRSDAIYCFDVFHDDGNGQPDRCCNPTDCKVSKIVVKVDKVITAPVAKASANGLTPIGSHVTQRIYANNPGDIAYVLTQLSD